MELNNFVEIETIVTKARTLKLENFMLLRLKNILKIEM